MYREVITRVVMCGGQHGSSDWSECLLGVFLLLCSGFFDCGLAGYSILVTFGACMPFSCTEFACLYDRTLPGGLQRLGRRRDLYDVGDAS